MTMEMSGVVMATGNARVVYMEDTVEGKVGTEAAQPDAPSQNPVLFVATPAYGCMLTSQYLQCLIQTQLALGSVGVGMCIDLLGNESLITRARNLLTKRFLDSQATHLLFIDADISWTPEAIIRVLRKDEGVVTGVYPKKYVDWNQVDQKLKEGSKEPVHMMGLDYNINVTDRELKLQNGFGKVMDAATGFMLIKREVVVSMYERYGSELFVVNDIIGQHQTIKDYVAVFDCMIDPDNRRSLSEDFAFSRRLQKMGGHVHADLAMALGHTGGFHYEGNLGQRLATRRGRERQLLAEQQRQEKSSQQDEQHQKFTDDGKKKVLLAILPTSNEQVSLGFVYSVVQSVSLLRGLTDVVVQIHFFKSKNEACDYLWNDDLLDCVIFADGLLGFEPELLVDMVRSPSPLYVGVYPKPELDWEAVREEQHEPSKTRGLMYSIGLPGVDEQIVDGRLEVPVAGLDIAKIDRCVLQVVRERLPPQCQYSGSKKCLWFHQGIMDDRVVHPDEMFCRAWGRGTTANVVRGVSKLGALTFYGCVLHRDKLR